MKAESSLEFPSSTTMVLLGGSGLLWVGVAASAPWLGSIAYAVPMVVLLVAIVAGVAAAACVGNVKGISLFFGGAVLIPNISFDQHELGEPGLNPQTGLKLGLWVIAVAIGIARHHQVTMLLRDRSFGLVAAFGVVAMVSAVWSPVPAYSAASAIGIFGWLVLAAVVATSVEDVSVWRIVTIALTVEIGIGLAAAIIAPDLVWIAPSVEETEFRLGGFSGHPNVFAQHAGILVLAAFIGCRVGALSRLVALLVSAIGIAALIASGSRVAMVATALTCALIAMRTLPFAKVLPLGILGLSALAILFIGLYGLPDLTVFLGDLSRTGTASEFTTLTGRTDLWGAAWGHFLERPLLGWGFNGTERLMADSVPASFEGTAINAHSMILQGLMSVGVLGSVPMLAAIAMQARRMLIQPDPTRDSLTIFLLIVGLGEAEMFATPVLLNLLFFWTIARDARRSLGCTSVALPGAVG